MCFELYVRAAFDESSCDSIDWITFELRKKTQSNGTSFSVHDVLIGFLRGGGDSPNLP